MDALDLAVVLVGGWIVVIAVAMALGRAASKGRSMGVDEGPDAEHTGEREELDEQDR